MTMEDFVVQVSELMQNLSQGFVPSSWQDRLLEVKQELSEMTLEVMTNKPYATGYTEEDEKKLVELEDEVSAFITAFRESLDQEPWVHPPVMKNLREAGDGIRLKVKELRKWQ